MRTANKDTLIMAENMAAYIDFFKAEVFALQTQEGFVEVASLIESGRLQVSDYNFIILLFG